MAWTTPRTWVNLEVVSHTTMNTHVRDNTQYLKDILDGAQSQDILIKATSVVGMTLRNTGAHDNISLRFMGNASAVAQWAVGNEVATGGTGRNFDIFDLVSSVNRMRVTSGGQVLVGDGSASAPALSFYTDTDSGLARFNPDDIGLVAGTAVVVWTRRVATVTQLGFHGSTPQAKPTVTGAKGGNAALTSLLSALNTIGLITDSSS